MANREIKDAIDYVTLGMQMKQIRLEHNLNLEDVGKILYKTHTAISRYENGKVKPDKETIMLFAKHFNVKVDDLLKKVSVVLPDTSALRRNKRLLHMLLETYDKVVIAQTVIDELIIQKNRGKRESEKRLAWQILANIDYYATEYPDRFTKEDNTHFKPVITDSRYANDPKVINDMKLVMLANSLAKKVIGVVDIIAVDIDITSKYDRCILVEDFVLSCNKTENYNVIITLKDEFDFDHLDYYKRNGLLDNLDLNAYLPDGHTLLTDCIQRLRPKENELPISRAKIYKKMEFLLANGADPNKNDNANYCMPPISHCAQMCDLNALNILLRNTWETPCDYNKTTQDERTQAKLKSGKLNEGNTALMIACYQCEIKIVERLLELDNICINQQDSNGYTPLMKCEAGYFNKRKRNKTANKEKYRKIEQLILDKKSPDLLIRDRKNRTFLDWKEFVDNCDSLGEYQDD